MNKKKISRFSVSLPDELLEKFDRRFKSKNFKNRSKALTDLIREKIIEETWQLPGQAGTAVVVMVYDHEKRDLSEKLTDLGHHHFKKVVANLHIHLNKENCLEIMIVRGKNKNLKKFADILARARGVKFVKLLPASTGGDVI